MSKALSPEVKAARKGARFLDKRVPGWFRKIRTRELDLSDPNVCILGQCFNGFSEGLAALLGEATWDTVDRDNKFAVSHGFEVMSEDVYDGAYERLGLAWLPLIKERRKAARVARASKAAR